jgi:glutamate-1-semialdehyde 2,1-aminomutase
LTTLGKIIGGGMPVGAYGGKKEIMDCVAPVGKVYQAGTLSGNPIAMAAGLTMLRYLDTHPEVYTTINTNTENIVKGIKNGLHKLGLNYTINHIGSMFSLFFTDQHVIDFETAKTSDTQKFAMFFRNMLQRGVYFPPSQFESLFISTALSSEDIATITQASFESLQ